MSLQLPISTILFLSNSRPSIHPCQLIRNIFLKCLYTVHCTYCIATFLRFYLLYTNFFAFLLCSRFEYEIFRYLNIIQQFYWFIRFIMKSSFMSFGRYLKQTVSLQIRETTLGHISNENKALLLMQNLRCIFRRSHFG